MLAVPARRSRRRVVMGATIFQPGKVCRSVLWRAMSRFRRFRGRQSSRWRRRGSSRGPRLFLWRHIVMATPRPAPVSRDSRVRSRAGGGEVPRQQPRRRSAQAGPAPRPTRETDRGADPTAPTRRHRTQPRRAQGLSQHLSQSGVTNRASGSPVLLAFPRAGFVGSTGHEACVGRMLPRRTIDGITDVPCMDSIGHRHFRPRRGAGMVPSRTSFGEPA